MVHANLCFIHLRSQYMSRYGAHSLSPGLVDIKGDRTNPWHGKMPGAYVL